MAEMIERRFVFGRGLLAAKAMKCFGGVAGPQPLMPPS